MKLEDRKSWWVVRTVFCFRLLLYGKLLFCSRSLRAMQFTLWGFPAGVHVGTDKEDAQIGGKQTPNPRSTGYLRISEPKRAGAMESLALEKQDFLESKARQFLTDVFVKLCPNTSRLTITRSRNWIDKGCQQKGTTSDCDN